MTTIRRIVFPFSLAAGRLAKRAERVTLVVLGIAAAAGVLAAVLGGSLVTQDRSLARVLAQVPPADRSVFVAHFGVPPAGGDYRSSLDPPVRRALRSLSSAEPIRVMQFKQTRIGGRLVNLAAIDGVGNWVRLQAGRLPSSCSVRRCEILEIGEGEGESTPPARIATLPDIPLVVVGRGELKSAVPFGRLAPASVGTTREEVPSQLLVAEGVSGLSALPALESIFRSYAWVVPLDAESVHPWGIDDFRAKVAQVRSTLEAKSLLFDVAGPDEELAAAAESSEVAGRRLLLIGGVAAALALAFAVLAAGSMRRDVDAAWRRLTWFGARRWQLVVLFAGEAGVLAAVGTLLGWAAGAGVSAVVAETAGSPAGSVLRHSVASPLGFALAVALIGVAALVLLVSLRAPAVRLGARSFSLVDVAALGAVLALGLALIRGEADPSALARSRGTGAFLIILPGLVGFVAAVACARALVPGLRLLERVARGAGVPVRLAVLSLARHPGHAAIAAAFLAVSVGLSLFAAMYRSTLVRGQDDQAAFAVPLDFILREDLSPSGLVSPLEAASLSGYHALGTDVEVVPTVRRRANVRLASRSQTVTLLGVPAGELATLHGWREDFASVPVGELASRIEPPRAMDLRGPSLPHDARELLVPLVLRGDDFVLTGSVETQRGDFVHLDLGETRGQGRQVLRAAVPDEAEGGRLVALTFGLTAADSESGKPEQGTLALDALSVRRRSGRTDALGDYGDWIGVNGIKAAGVCCPLAVRYFITQQVDARFRPSQPSDGSSVPVVVTSRLAGVAGPGGSLPIRILGLQFAARVVGTAERFPSVSGDFVLADQRWLATALNTSSPGSGVVNEIWLGAPSERRAAELERRLARPPFDVLEVRSRLSIEAELRGDPLARGALITLAAGAAVALALALIGLLLVLVADLRDERGELFVLEAEGAGPAALRRHLRLRMLIVAGFGLVGGIATGAVLSAIVVDLIVITASAAAPEPPLLLAPDWPLLAGGLAGYAFLTTALVGAVTWGAFRAPTPIRSAEASTAEAGT